METLVAGVIGLSLLAILLTAALGLGLAHRSRRRRPADQYQRELHEIQRITRARSETRYTRQVGDAQGGNYGSGSGA
jgi:hypothetical protein